MRKKGRKLMSLMLALSLLMGLMSSVTVGADNPAKGNIIHNSPVGEVTYETGAVQPMSTGRYFISLTFDDGPRIPETNQILDYLSTLNDREQVICGRNGVDPCGPGVGCGKVCGSISRAQVSFYVMGQEANFVDNTGSILKRMLKEGHSIENHTWTHQPSGASAIGTLREEIIRVNNLIAERANGVTDFYGNAYSSSNPYKPFSFRPPRFEAGPSTAGLDKELNMPWIFAGIDTDDWRGHTAEEMAKYMLQGMGPHCKCTGTGWVCNIKSTPFGGASNGSANGGIILMHDGGNVRAETVKSLAHYIPQMQELGYHFVTIEQLYEYLNAEPEWVPPDGKMGPDGKPVLDWEGNRIYRVNDWVVPGATYRQKGADVSGAPTLNGTPTDRSITVNAVTISNNPGGQTVEYAISTSTTAPARGWQKSTTFNDLAGATTYYVYARSARNIEYSAGTPQRSAAITTQNPVVSFSNLTVNSNATQLTIEFDQAIPGLTPSDITVEGATKGTLAGPFRDTTMIYNESFDLPNELVDAWSNNVKSEISDTQHAWRSGSHWWPDDGILIDTLNGAVLQSLQYFVAEFSAPVTGNVGVSIGSGAQATVPGNGQTTVAVKLSDVPGISSIGSAQFILRLHRPAGSTLTKAYLSNGGKQVEIGPTTYTLVISNISAASVTDIKVTMSKTGFTFNPVSRTVGGNISNPDITPTPTPTTNPNGHVEDFVIRIYQNVFGRDPHPVNDGKDFWVEALTSGIEDISGVLYGFFFSHEFLAREVSNDDFIIIAYKTFLGRDPDPDGFAYWRDTLERGFNRRYVIENMITDEEFTRICEEYGMEVGPVEGREGFVSRMYRIVLNRKYDHDGFDHWNKGLESKHLTAADIVDEFFFGTEFEGRNTTNAQFVEIVYNACMNRDPEEGEGGGGSYWRGLLDDGVNRRVVLKYMLETDEFKDICDRYGIEVGVIPLGTWDEEESPMPVNETQDVVLIADNDEAEVDDAEVDKAEECEVDAEEVREIEEMEAEAAA